MKSQYEVILGDTKNVLKEMIEKGERVDMIFTSPTILFYEKEL